MEITQTIEQDIVAQEPAYDVSGHLFFLAAIAAVALAGCINVNISNNGNNNGAANGNGGRR